ncbi:hypothetical protein BMF94_3545 [Rhodotorula taiwanensis]|uniref:Uncharacterized protein n=1 Tax=Rhodotorula taiwanensis TaxID=741276 RepID=A0A2S5B8W2_9BASI|nr:hypothetical protein BMF94_3545 [Rhodotorula taiwanensis]
MVLGPPAARQEGESGPESSRRARERLSVRRRRARREADEPLRRDQGDGTDSGEQSEGDQVPEAAPRGGVRQVQQERQGACAQARHSLREMAVLRWRGRHRHRLVKDCESHRDRGRRAGQDGRSPLRQGRLPAR